MYVGKTFRDPLKRKLPFSDSFLSQCGNLLRGDKGYKNIFFVVMSLLMSWCHIGVEIRGTMTSRFFFFEVKTFRAQVVFLFNF